LRRYEQGESEAAGIGSSALDALTGRKSEIVDIFLWGNALLAPDAGRTCQKYRKKSRDFATAWRRRYSHAGTRHGSPINAAPNRFQGKDADLGRQEAEAGSIQAKSTLLSPKTRQCRAGQGAVFPLNEAVYGVIDRISPAKQPKPGNISGLDCRLFAAK
jgi:hypothetical protein